MFPTLAIKVPRRALRDFCRHNGIRSLAFFGSVTRSDFGPESDVDVLVDFEPGQIPGLLKVAGMGDEMSRWFGGRFVDLKTPACFRPATLAKVLSEAVLQYGPHIRRPRPAATHARSSRKGSGPRQKKQTR